MTTTAESPPGTSSTAPTPDAGRPRSTHVHSLDGVRAVAAFGVIATHAGFNSGRSLERNALAPFLARLDFGVTLFFLLSGFLLFRPFAAALLDGRPLPSPVRFWWRRLVRIVPAYWLTVIVTLVWLSARRATPSDWVAYLTLTHTYTSHDLDPALRQMWTLPTELAFYAVLPLIAVVCRVAGRWLGPLRALCAVIAVLALIALAANLTVHASVGAEAPALQWLPAFLDWFGLGMLIAVISCVPAGRVVVFDTARQWSTAAPGTCWLIGGLTFWIATLPIAGPYDLSPLTTWQWTIRHLLYGVAAFFFVLPAMLGGSNLPRRVLGNPVMAWLGVVSYGVYLWHLPLMLAFQRWFGWATFSGHFVELWLLTSAAATVVAAASWYLLERPLLRRAGRPWRSRTTRHDDRGAQGDEAQQLDEPAAGERVG